MQPQHEASVREILNPRIATNLKVEGKPIRDVIKEILGEELKKLKNVRLTWKPGALEQPVDPSKQTGQLRRDGLPYMGPIGQGKYYIQNGLVLFSNGLPVKDMLKISDVKPKSMNRDGTVVEYPSDQERVREHLANYISQALQLDPNLCPYCMQFSCADKHDYMKHVYALHRREFQAELEAGEEELGTTRVDMMADLHGQERPEVLMEKDTPPRRPPGRPPPNSAA